MERYTEQEDKELNAELKKMQRRAKRLISSDYYDSAIEKLSELEMQILKTITNAERHYDVNPYLWNTGLMEKTLDSLSKKIKEARKDSC